MSRYVVGAALLLGACVTDSTKAEAKAERFVGLLQTKNYAGARSDLKHFGAKQPSAAELEAWWATCTRKAGPAKGWRLQQQRVTNGIGSIKTAVDLRYELDAADGTEVPLFFTVKLEHGDWLVSNFACGLPKPAGASP